MGFLDKLGEVLDYDQLRPIQKELKSRALAQFLNLVKSYQSWTWASDQCLNMLWGDQIQAHMINLEPLSLYLPQSIPELKIKSMSEYGRWMIQTIPHKPYQSITNICEVFKSMQERYQQFDKLPCQVITIPALPFFGNKMSKSKNPHSQSLFIDDSWISQHPRFPGLTANIRKRRGSKVKILPPIFKDQKTNMKPTPEQPFPGYVYMDAMAFGMGMCCLQATYLTKNISHARYLYDQLSILSPLFLSLSAATPFAKGKLLQIDTRWSIISGSVDDRTQQQLDHSSSKYIPKSRYSSISMYLSQVDWNFDKYSDLKFPINQEIMQEARQKISKMGLKIDEKLLKHMSFLALRDFVILYDGILKESDQGNVIFEHLQSSNWNNVRFKPPPSPTSQIGWRVQFRTIQVQLTSNENALFSLLLSFIVRFMDFQQNFTNLYLPISLVDINFERAQKMDSITKQKFYWRINIQDKLDPVIHELTLFQIFFGKKQIQYCGLIPLIQQRVSRCKCQKQRHNLDSSCMSLISFFKKKMLGEKKTMARWMRDFITSHKGYQHDSVIKQEISKDLLNQLIRLRKGQVVDENLELPMCKCY